MSPDGEAIVTGAGDETLRFWNVFSKTRSTKVSRGLMIHHISVFSLTNGRKILLATCNYIYFLNK